MIIIGAARRGSDSANDAEAHPLEGVVGGQGAGQSSGQVGIIRQEAGVDSWQAGAGGTWVGCVRMSRLAFFFDSGRALILEESLGRSG